MKSKKAGIVLVIFILFISCGLFTLLSQITRDSKLDINEENFNNFNTKLKYSNIIPKEPETKILGENITFSVNFTSGSPPEPVNEASVFYYIQKQAVNISTELLNFSEISPGIYNKTIDTSKPIDSGGAILNSSIMYVMVVIARKIGLPEEYSFINFLLNPKNSSLTPNVTSLEVIWEKNISLEVHYQGTPGPIDLDGATVNYYVREVSGLFGSLVPQGNGIYRLTMNTTLFPEAEDRTYIIVINANIQNYELQQAYIDVTIESIPTKINGTSYLIPLIIASEIYVGEEIIFYFNYSIASTGVGITSASVDHIAHMIHQESGAHFIQELIHVGNGIWNLDINSESLIFGNYDVHVSIKERNFEEVEAYISLTIKKRVSVLELYLNQQNKTSDIIPSIFDVGDKLNITLKYKDCITGLHVSSATVNISSNSGFSSNLEENGTQYTLILDPITSGLQRGLNTIIISVESSDHENASIIFQIMIVSYSTDLIIPQLLIPGPDILIIMLISLIGVMCLILYYKTKMRIHSF